MSALEKMNAIVYEEYGPPDVLRFRVIEKPSPKDDEILIKVQAASVTPLDWHLLTGTPYLARIIAGLLKPKHNVLGTDVSGIVETVGKNITRFSPGDEIFGLSFYNGAFAEYLCAPQSQLELVPKTPNISFEDAAATPYSGFTALFCLRELGNIEPGQKVLINGASGGTGTFAVQIAKAYGAEVTGVCSTRNLERVLANGADHVIDYTQDDFSHNTGAYDLIFDVVRKRNFSECRDALKRGGNYVTTEFSPGLIIQSLWVSKIGDKRLVPLPMKRPIQQDLLDLKDLLETGKIKPIIDRIYKLDDVPDALQYISEGHARGKILIQVQ